MKLNVKCFNLKYTLECGQCFRWKKVDEKQDRYIGVIKDRVIDIYQNKDSLYVYSNNEDNLEEVIKEYFDLDKDYEQIEKRISKIDKNINTAVKNTTGLRILNQDLFEIIISYIISANNNIKRISKSVDEISKMFGDKVEYNNEEYYLFPTASQLKNATVKQLLAAGVGFRAKYIKETVSKINQNKELLNELKSDSKNNAKEKLLEFPGVGPKVSDCILLFSLNKSEVFPIDVWVKRVMEKLYFKENVSMAQIAKYAEENFKSDAGIVQQHLFYNVREGNI